MSKAHFIVPTGATEEVTTVRLGSAIATAGVPGTGGSMYPGLDDGKLVKQAGESQYDLCVAGDPIMGVITSVEMATSGGWTIGGTIDEGKIFATADGLQATPGTGVIALGDFVVAGTITAKGTALAAYPKVCKATVQPGDVPASLTAAGAQVLAALYSWKVVSLGTAGTGAVGTTIVIKRIGS
jgi:hypothetical protein